MWRIKSGIILKRRLLIVKTSNPPIGAIAYGRSGIGGIITEIEADRAVLRFPDGLKRVPIGSIVRWELPRSTVNHKPVLGDRVRYVGTNFNLGKQYAGVLEVWEIGKLGDSDKCTCLKPDGRPTSWIEFADIKLVEVAQ
jgi:hypothetical protein